jgi:hypothetical protein
VVIGVLVAVASVTANLLGVGQAYLLVGLVVGNVALAARRRLAQRQARSGSRPSWYSLATAEKSLRA